ncbi:I78 family peptidase inhibitor [Fuscovulum ytuae]|uniref:I78 family peptidase inhibitor n=1 Tax=Fuscovulum ytuae TaxID=3042299 RepID=A0ABY8Q290_9RHOB|nr:I78 family peptidase inhibitor [Fuscovulum sp. YMD61]WGV14779.1 I78 family peptidase inhibitor [Fuscovulum sp. YMD61]
MQSPKRLILAGLRQGGLSAAIGRVRLGVERGEGGRAMLRTSAAGVAMMVVLGVSGCVPAGADVAVEPVNQCGALDVQDLVGTPARELNTAQFNKPVRVIYPDMAVTMDYNPERLNFDVDRAGLIARVTCG